MANHKRSRIAAATLCTGLLLGATLPAHAQDVKRQGADRKSVV